MADSNISHKKLDITGQRYGRLVAIEYAGYFEQRSGKKRSWWKCQCDCGRIVDVCLLQLRSGRTQSCGCLKSEVTAELNRTRMATHGASRRGQITPEYRAYTEAKRRCTSPHRQDYENYGARNIQFKFESFEQFLQEIGPKPDPLLTLERVDNNGNYECGNIVWADRSRQCRNRRVTKLTADDVRTIRRLIGMGIRRDTLAKAFNVSLKLICNIANRKVWVNLPPLTSSSGPSPVTPP